MTGSTWPFRARTDEHVAVGTRPIDMSWHWKRSVVAPVVTIVVLGRRGEQLISRPSLIVSFIARRALCE